MLHLLSLLPLSGFDIFIAEGIWFQDRRIRGSFTTAKRISAQMGNRCPRTFDISSVGWNQGPYTIGRSGSLMIFQNRNPASLNCSWSLIIEGDSKHMTGAPSPRLGNFPCEVLLTAYAPIDRNQMSMLWLGRISPIIWTCGRTL